MKNYYQILDVSPEAGEEEIKRSYRRLAVTFHPDKNPSQSAEDLIKEINEAYEVLSDPQKRLQYDILLRNPWMVDNLQNQRPRHRDPAYNRRFQPGYKPPPPTPSERTVMMRNSLGFMRHVSVIGLVFCVVIGLDYFLPPKIVRERVDTDIHLIGKLKLRTQGDMLITEEEGHHFPAGIHELSYFPHHSMIRIYTSRVFSLVIKVESETGDYELNNLATVYRNFSFAPILLIVLTTIMLIWRKGVEFQFTMGVVIMFMMFLNIIFMLMSRL